MAYNLMGEVRKAMKYSKEEISNIEVLFVYQQVVSEVEYHHSKFKDISLSDDQIKDAFSTQGESLEDIEEVAKPEDGRKLNIYRNELFKYTDPDEILEKLRKSYFDAYQTGDKNHVKAVNFYTERYIYFTVFYDGFVHIDYIPRNPENMGVCEIKCYGGGSGADSFG